MSDDVATGLADAARRAVEGEKPAPQLRSKAVDEVPEGDRRRQIGARPALTITEAARAADVDRRTIRRRLDGGALPNAYREDGDGPWRIPVEDLLAAGYRLHAPDAPPDDSAGHARADAPPPPERAELAEWRRRAEVAEALAAERERTIRALELALRALEPGPSPTTGHTANPTAVPVAPAPAPTEGSERRRWWQRGR